MSNRSSSANPCFGSVIFVITMVDTAPGVFCAVTPTHSERVGVPSLKTVSRR